MTPLHVPEIVVAETVVPEIVVAETAVPEIVADRIGTARSPERQLDGGGRSHVA